MNKCLVIMTICNRLESTKKSIESVLKNDYPFDLCVVDNNSTDGTLLCLMKLKVKYKKRIRLIALDKNEGKGAAANYGIFQNFNSYDYFISIDNDIIAPEDCFRILIDCSKYIKNWALIAPEYAGEKQYHYNVSTDKRYEKINLPNGYTYITKRMGIRGGIWLMNKEFLKKYHGYSTKRIYGLHDKDMLVDTLKGNYNSGIIPEVKVIHSDEINKKNIDYLKWKNDIRTHLQEGESDYKASDSFFKSKIKE